MKSIDPSVVTALDSDSVRLVAFVQINFTSGVQYYCTAGHSLPWNGQNWVGLGALSSISPIKETEAVESPGLKLSLVGFNTTVAPNLIALSLGEAVQGRTMQLWVGFLDPVNYQLLATPTLEFKGRLDTLSIEEDGEEAHISVTVESRFAYLLRAAPRRYTDEDQRARYPNDRFFEYIAQMKERVVVFPSRELQQR